MKKFILASLALLSLATTASAQQYRPGNRGPEFVRIEIGDDRDDREMLKRIVRLEREVRNLQNKVFQLQEEDRREELSEFQCSGNIFNVGIVKGKGRSKREAILDAMEDCYTKAPGTSKIFCDEKDIRCN